MKEKNTTVKATTTAEKSNNSASKLRPFMSLDYFRDTLCLLAQVQKEDVLFGSEDEEAKEIFTSLYNKQVKEIKSGKLNKLLEFVGVLEDNKIDMEKLYTAVQTLRLLKFKDNVDDHQGIPFKSSLYISFKTLDIIQFSLRRSGVNKI